MKTSKPTALPPTALALLRALGDAGGSLLYHGLGHPTQALTALRHRGLAGVTARTPSAAPRVTLTEAGHALYATLTK